MLTPSAHRKLSITAFALDAAPLQGQTPLAQLPRLADEAVQGVAASMVHFQALGSMREDAAGKTVPWLQLQGYVDLELVCQRCLEPMNIPVQVDRWFRLVADEATALAEDDAAEEDLLAMDHEFDAFSLLEDDLLLAMPLVPRHDACHAPLSAALEDDLPHPFAALAALKAPKQ
jgi:uncharacterized protein